MRSRKRLDFAVVPSAEEIEVAAFVIARYVSAAKESEVASSGIAGIPQTVRSAVPVLVPSIMVRWCQR